MPANPLRTALQHLRRANGAGEGAGWTDAQLLTQFSTVNDEGAFEALVRRHGPMVLGVCRRVLRNEQDAEDAFQATFLVLAQKAGSITRRQTVGGWLYGVAYRTALKARSTADRRARKEREAAQMRGQGTAGDDAWLDLLPLLDEELSRLPELYRVPVVLCDLEGRTRKEAAGQLGCPEGTLSARLARARAMLAKRLAGRGLPLPAAALAGLLAREPASASVPAALVSATVRAAITGVLPAKIAALTHGVLQAMLLVRVKIATGALLIAGALGGAMFITLAQAGRPPAHYLPDAKKIAVTPPAPEPEVRPGAILDKAIRTVGEVKDEARQAFALLLIGSAQARIGHRDAARTFECAVKTAHAIRHANGDIAERQKGRTLMYVAEAQAQAGQIEAALRTAGTIEVRGSNWKGLALAHVAAAQARAGDRIGAMKTVASTNGRDRSLALYRVASALAEGGDTRQAFKAAEGIHDDYRVYALTAIAVAQDAAGDQVGAKKSIVLARDAAEAIEDDNPNPDTSLKNHARREVARAMIVTGDEKGGLKATELLKGYGRDVVLAELAVRQAKAGKVKEALRTLADLRWDGRRGEVLRAVAIGQAQSADMQAARKTIEAIKDIGERSKAFEGLATVRMKAGDRTASGLYREAIDVLRNGLDTLWHENGVMSAAPHYLHRIVSAWAEAGDAQGALAWADKQESAFVRAVALAGVAEGVAKRQNKAGKK